MTFVLSHISALEYWRTARLTSGVCDKGARNEVAHAKKFITRKPTLESAVSASLSGISQPYHVLVSDRQIRQQSKLFTSHTWDGPLIKGSIIAIEKDIFVSSPELCFIQLARSLPLTKLITVGFELCGHYNGPSQALTSVSHLKNFTMKYKGVHSTNKATRALSYIIDNSASPMETKLAMLLSLPLKMGGYNFPKPLLNEQISKVGREGSTRGEHYVADLLWPDDRVILEYDSNEYHATVKSHINDSIRRAELAALDYDVTSVVSSHVLTAIGTKNLAVLLAKKLSRRLVLPEPNFSKACKNLREEIL